MALKLSGENKPYITDIPSDTYPAVCVGVYDIGTVHSDMFDKDQEKLIFLFEIPELTNEEGFPRTIHVEVGQSLHPKANLNKHCVNWRGKSFTDEELSSFDVRTFLGQPASLLIVHVKGKGLKEKCVYANVQTISKLPRGTPVPMPTRQPCYFDFTEGKTAIPEGTPEYIIKKIQAAPEWEALKSGSPKPSGQPARRPAGVVHQAPPEIVGPLNEIGLGWPYTQKELDDIYPPDFGTEIYDVLCQYVTPF